MLAILLPSNAKLVPEQVADDARRLNITIAESDERICNVQHMIENQNDIIYQLSKQKEEFLSMNGDNRAAIDELKNSLKFQTQPAPREPLSSQTKKVNPHGALSENIEKAKKQCKGKLFHVAIKLIFNLAIFIITFSSSGSRAILFLEIS